MNNPTAQINNTVLSSGKSQYPGGMIAAFEDAVKKYTDKTALIEDSGEVTYGGLWDDICLLSEGLRKIEIMKGDKLVIVLPNSKEFIHFFFASVKIGAVVVPLQPTLSVREYRQVLEKVSPSLVVTTGNIFREIFAVEESLVESYSYVVRDDSSGIKSKYSSVRYIRDIFELGKGSQRLAAQSDQNEIVSINFTYRGYGYPLGAVLTHENYLSAIDMAYSAGVAAKSFLSSMPMAHVSSYLYYVLLSLMHGFQVVMIKSIAAWEFLKAVERYHVEIIYGSPSFYTYLLKSFDAQKFDLSSVKFGIVRGNFLSAQLHDELEHGLGIPLLQSYGLTEGLIVSLNTLSRRKVPSLGCPFDSVEVKILNDQGEPVALGQTGEIFVKSPSVMNEYYEDPAATREVLQDGWIATGDYGRRDEEDFLFFEGVKKTIAKVGGQIVDLREVEEVIQCHPHVRSVNVFADRIGLNGGSVIAEVRTEVKTTEEEILQFCARRLASYKLPKKIYVENKEYPQILVLDNDSECQCSYLYDLNNEGYNVQLADSCCHAVELMQKESYSLVIAEIVLPDKSGMELLKEIKAAAPEVPVLMITDHFDVLEECDLSGYNIIAKIVKPVMKADLLHFVKSVKMV